MQDFTHYSAAKRTGDKVVADLVKGQATALSPGQASDALAAFQRLQRYYQDTGRRVSLLVGISEYCEAASLVPNVVAAVEGYLSTVSKVKRKDVSEEVEQFIAERELKTHAEGNRRPQLSPEHHYNTSLWLRQFAKTFPGHAISDLSKEGLNLYMQKHKKVGPKTRNERRGVVTMLLKWCVEQDYLSPTHRLFEASGFKQEPADDSEIECYSADELGALLERASKQPGPTKDGKVPEVDYRDLLPVLALVGLAGMRFKEITRLDWEDVLGRPDPIEAKAAKSKTRSRRLITTYHALSAWLEPYRDRTGPVWTKGYDMLHEDFAALRESLKIPNRHNGLRHAFVSAHFAAYSDENLTAAQAGNRPQMIHAHYNGRWTKAEGEAWFAVSPAKLVSEIQARLSNPLGKLVLAAPRVRAHSGPSRL